MQVMVRQGHSPNDSMGYMVRAEFWRGYGLIGKLSTKGHVGQVSRATWLSG